MLILSFLKRNERISVIKMIFSYENLNGKLKIGHFWSNSIIFDRNWGFHSWFSIEFIRNYLDRSRILVSAESARIIPFPKIKNSSSFVILTNAKRIVKLFKCVHSRLEHAWIKTLKTKNQKNVFYFKNFKISCLHETDFEESIQTFWWFGPILYGLKWNGEIIDR